MKFPWILFFNVVLLILDSRFYVFIHTNYRIYSCFVCLYARRYIQNENAPILKKRRVHEYGKIMSDFK